MKKIILATTSPHRKEAFKMLKIDFAAEASNIDESQLKRDNPEKLVLELSKLKAKAVAKNHADAIVIGMDSVGFFDGKIFEKPKTRQEAFDRLKMLSENNYQFYTGIYMVDTKSGQVISQAVRTQAFLRQLTDQEINKYLDEDPNYKTYAVGSDPLGHYSSTFIRRIKGSYNNLLRGIPLEAIVEMLQKFDAI